MMLRVVFEPWHERLSPPAGEASLEFLRWVRDEVAAREGVTLAEWVTDNYQFADEPPGEAGPVPDGRPLFS